MRLLLLTLDFPPMRGGVASYLDGLARFFRDQITVVAPPQKGWEGLGGLGGSGGLEGMKEFDLTCGYSVKRISLLNKWVNPHWFPTIWYLVSNRSSYDTVIVSHVLPMGTAAWFAKMVTRKPFVIIVHGMDVALARRNPWKRRLAGMVLRGAKAVVCNTKALEKEVKDAFGVKQTIVCYPSVAGLMPESATSPNPSPSTPLRTGLAKEGNQGLRLLTVSRLVERKGQMRVLEALSKLRTAGKGALFASYTIIGSGPMETELREATDRLGLNDVVAFAGDVDDATLHTAYNTCDAFIMPTIGGAADREGFGMVYVEAALCGIPSIASHLPGVDEAVLDGKTGILVPDGDVDALASAIERLANNPVERRQLGEAAKIRATYEFTADKQFGKLREALGVRR